MEMISKMDKKELENGIARANEFIKNNNKDEIIKKLNNK